MQLKQRFINFWVKLCMQGGGCVRGMHLYEHAYTPLTIYTHLDMETQFKKHVHMFNQIHIH